MTDLPVTEVAALLAGAVKRMTELTRDHYRTGKYGDCAFHVAGDVVAALLQTTPPRVPWPAWDALSPTLTGLRVVAEPDAAEGTWQLRRTGGEVVEQWPPGNVAARRDWPCGLRPLWDLPLICSCGWTYQAHRQRPAGEPHHPWRSYLCDDPDCCPNGCPQLTCAVCQERWPCATKQAHVEARRAATLARRGWQSPPP